jgi:hypothetical protein
LSTRELRKILKSTKKWTPADFLGEARKANIKWEETKPLKRNEHFISTG